MNLPDFNPLKLTQSSRAITRSSFDQFDHVVVVVPKSPATAAFKKLPQGTQLQQLLKRAARRGETCATTRAGNSRATGITIASFDASSEFAALTWAKRTLAEALRDKPGTLGVTAAGFNDAAVQRPLQALVAAAYAAAFDLPSFKTTKEDAGSLRQLRLIGVPSLDLEPTAAAALGNNVARWFTALPPNVLNAASYREAIETLAKERSIDARFIGEAELEKLGAGAFLAVSRGNATREAGIMHLRYRPARTSTPGVALVGKGIIFDTGGTNLKPFKGMLDMHTDMQGSAVALGSLLALAALEAPFAVDAWLAITENRLSADSYKSQDVVHAANGTSIQIIHTDAEGRMVLADTLALAGREKPQIIIDYATLTGACVVAVTERYSGVFSNRPAANQVLIDAGVACGERVWPFPMDDDFDEPLKSEIADVKQCSAESAGDHILAARFLRRFVPSDIPWIHVDLSAGQSKGGLAHIPSEITGFGVRLTLELLRNQFASPAALAARLSA